MNNEDAIINHNINNLNLTSFTIEQLELLYFENIHNNYKDLIIENIKINENIKNFLQKKRKNKNNKVRINSKKCGRKKSVNSIILNKIHSKESYDNIFRKIKVLYHNFIINFLNDFIKKLYSGFQRYLLRKFSGKITQNVTKEYNKKLCNTTLREFLKSEISEKYKYEYNKNKKYIDKLYSYRSELSDILNLTYIEFYMNFFLSNDRKKFEEKFGISEKTKFFYECLDLLKNKDIYKNDKLYIAKLEDAGRDKFIEFMYQNNNISSTKYSNYYLNEQKKIFPIFKTTINSNYY